MLRRPIPPRALWGELVLAGLCTIVGFPVFTALAMFSVPAAHGGVVLGIVPLATAAAAALVAHERPSPGFWLVSLIGAAIVLAFVLSRPQARAFALGDLFLLGTVLSGAFGYALSGRLSLRMPGWEVVSWQVTGFLPLSLLAMLLLWPHDLAAVPLQAWAGLAYVGLVSQYFAFFVFNAAMAAAGVARVGQLMLLQPFVIVVLAALINGEPISASTLAFAAAVVAIGVDRPAHVGEAAMSSERHFALWMGSAVDDFRTACNTECPMHAIDALYREHLALRQLPSRELIEQHTSGIADKDVARAIAGRLACALPSAEAIDYLRRHLRAPLLTVASGVGFWAHCLRHAHGIETLATDLYRAGRQSALPAARLASGAAEWTRSKRCAVIPDHDVLGVCLPPGLSLQQIYQAAPQATSRQLFIAGYFSHDAFGGSEEGIMSAQHGLRFRR